jgi:hypothetical protein
MTTRRFPPPWTAEKMPGGYVVRDANGQGLACAYCRVPEAGATRAKAPGRGARRGYRPAGPAPRPWLRPWAIRGADPCDRGDDYRHAAGCRNYRWSALHSGGGCTLYKQTPRLAALVSPMPQ